MKDIRFTEKHTELAAGRPYYLGLDIGTSSIGYAITDENYNIIKKAGKSLWGAHLFKEAETAAKRRAFRTARRRHKRMKTRIKLLQEFFAEAVNAVDPGFFIRMKDSFFYPDDKEENQKNALFNDSDFKDKDYFKAYPTIYHLRQELCTSKDEHDVRLVYLACHHILKNRGHFLSDNVKIGQSDKSAKVKLEEFIERFSLDEPLFSESEIDNVWKILTDRTLTRTDKSKQMQEILQDKSKRNKEACKLLSGCTATIKNMMDKEDAELAEGDDKIKVCLLDNYEEKVDLQAQIENFMGDEKEIIDIAYDFMQALILYQLLQKDEDSTYSTISEARVAMYERHKSDLNQLKKVIRDLQKSMPDKKEEIAELKNLIFRTNKKGLFNYVAYSGHIGRKGQSSPENTCTQDEFLSFLKKELSPYWKDTSNEDLIDIKNRIELGEFMPRIRSSANGSIPYQLQEYELDQILENASSYLPFLKNQDNEANMTVKDMILSLLTYKIPYYVGPFDDRSDFAWIKRNEGYEHTKIRPWNADLVINEAETAERFIRNLTNKCTFLLGEDVLPKQSLLYEEYLAWNAINNLKYDGLPLAKDVRERLYNDLFLESSGSGKITHKKVLGLINNYGIKSSTNNLTGMDEEIPVKFKAHKDFRAFLELEDGLVKDGILTVAEVEQIIEKLTAFPKSGRLVQDWLKSEFGSKLSDDEIKQISKKDFSGWGRLSSKLLNGITAKTGSLSGRRVIEIMRNEGLNLMQVLESKNGGFIKAIDEYNSSFNTDKGVISEEFLDDYNLSPPVHKALRRTLLLCKELFEIMGGAPKKIFIEMAREKEAEKKRTVSRKEKIKSLYKDFKSANSVWDALSNIEEDRFKSKALYLYAMQQGRCMYSGEIIPLDDILTNSGKYDIDHIYPRSLTKDDSFNNLVLVRQDLNRSKSNVYPLSDDIRKKNADRWGVLKAANFISAEKYYRLMRATPLSSEELEKFVNRQLVETRQSTKVVKDILTDLLSKTKVITVKAGLVSDFRYKDGIRDKAAAEFYFPKVRAINDKRRLFKYCGR